MTKKNPDARPTAERLAVPRAIRKFWMSAELQAAAVEYAHSQRTTISQLVRDQLVDIERNPLDPTRLSDVDAPSSSNHVSVAVEDELYLGAKDSAYPTRHSLTSLVRRRLVKILESEGLWEAA